MSAQTSFHTTSFEKALNQSQWFKEKLINNKSQHILVACNTPFFMMGRDIAKYEVIDHICYWLKTRSTSHSFLLFLSVCRQTHVMIISLLFYFSQNPPNWNGISTNFQISWCGSTELQGRSFRADVFNFFFLKKRIVVKGTFILFQYYFLKMTWI